MIRLRRHIERGLRHPLVGPVLLLLVAVLVVFTVLHELGEGLPGEAAMACVAIALVLMTVVPLTGSPLVAARPAAVPPSRAPPVASRELRVVRIGAASLVPLRL